MVLFFSLTVAMNQIPFLIVAILLMIKYNNFIINEQKVRNFDNYKNKNQKSWS